MKLYNEYFQNKKIVEATQRDYNNLYNTLYNAIQRYINKGLDKEIIVDDILTSLMDDVYSMEVED